MKKLYPIETNYKEGKIEIKATVWGEKEGNSIERWFHFDTGAQGIMLPLRVLEQIQAKKLGESEAEVFGGSRVKIGLYQIQMECGGFKVNGTPVGSSESDQDYLIGMSFIEFTNLGFYFDGKQLFWVR